MSSRRAVVLGAGGHAKVVIATLEALGWEVAAAFDDAEARWGGEILNVPLLGGLEAAVEHPADGAVLAIGDNRDRREIAGRLELPWISAVHPSAVVHPSVSLGAGTVVFAGAVIQPDTEIGRHAIVNTGASVDHDCHLGDFVHVAPGARLAGSVTVGEGSLIGVGTSTVPGVTIGAWSLVGAGSVVIRDLGSQVVAYGNPARQRAASLEPSASPRGSTKR